MPGAFTSFFLVAFDVDCHGQAIAAFKPRSEVDEATAIEKARVLAKRHAGVVVWKREAKPAIGEEGEPVIIWQTGTIGDFD